MGISNSIDILNWMLLLYYLYIFVIRFRGSNLNKEMVYLNNHIFLPSWASEEAVTSKLHQIAKLYPNVDAIKWSKVPENIWKRQALPTKPGHLAPTTWNEKVPWLVLACSPNEHRPRTSMLPHRHIWKLARKINFDFNDMQICFHLGAMEMNLIRT